MLKMKLNNLLEKVYLNPELEDLVYLLSLKTQEEKQILYYFADKVRREFMGEGVLLRGIIEFSNTCRNSCLYCGLNKFNKKLERYRLSRDEILASVKALADQGIKTVVLQSGEEDGLKPDWLAEIISEIKKQFDIAITLSVGERAFKNYKLWKDAGADRYLLKIETTDRELYDILHPGMSFENRLRCLKDLQKLNYQTGSGIIIGLKNQSIESIGRDIQFLKRENFEMIGIGPFIPHQQTKLGNESKGELDLTLKTVALTRIVTRNAHLPATTALGSLGDDYRIDGLKAGANVLMPNFTPIKYKELYEIYPGKRCISEAGSACIGCLNLKVEAIGRKLDFSRGDSLR